MARVLLTTMQVQSEADELLRPLTDAGHELRIHRFSGVPDEDAVIAALDGAAAAIVGVEPYTARVLDSCPSLKILSRTGVGYDAIDVDAATARGIVVATTPGTNHHSVAEAAVALLLAAMRRIAFADRQMRTTGWNPRPYGVELRGKTVGVVGTGLIGKEVVRRLQGWGVTILLSDVVQDQAFAAEHGARYVERDELLREADAITLHAPLLPATRHLIDDAALRTMKPTAYLVNTARGPLVDEAAVARALAEGRLAGAALDVFEVEPLPTDSPLLKLDTITLTQHVAGVTRESMQAMTEMAVDSVARVLRGEPPVSCVNPEALEQ